MELKKLNPDQIITLNDYPVHSDSVLSEYFTKCKQGEELPYVPVIRKNIVKKYLNKTSLENFEKFENNHPNIEYFMLDGSHRTTALTLADIPITAMVYETDSDIKEAKKLVTMGQILQNDTLNHSLEENCELLYKHFSKKPYFMTVEQKTKKMIDDNILPKVITSLYQNSN